MLLKNLVFSMRQYLSEELGVKPSVGHTYELLASLMGYETFASLSSQAFLVSLRGSHWNVIENVRILLTGNPDRDGAIKRHAALKAPGEAWAMAKALEKFATEHELVAVPLQALLDHGFNSCADPWFDYAFDELLKGLVTISHDQLELALSMLEDASAREPRLRPPLIRLYQILQECFEFDPGLSTYFRERAEHHKHGSDIDGSRLMPSSPSVDLWSPAYGSACGVVVHSPDVDSSLAAESTIKAILPLTPHTIWATHDGSLNHLEELGFAKVSLSLPRRSQPDRICLNPFIAEVSHGHSDELIAIARILHLMIDSVHPQYCTESPGLLDGIQEAVYDFYRDRERNAVTAEPTMRDFQAWLDGFHWRDIEGEDISFALASFFGGGRYAGLFDGSFALGSESDWVLFDTKALEGTPALAPAMLILAMQLDAKCRRYIRLDDRKALIMGHNWLSHTIKGFTVPFSQLYKAFRRYNLGVLAISPSIQDYWNLQDGHHDKDLADGLLANTSHSFVLTSTANGYALEHATFTYEQPV